MRLLIDADSLVYKAGFSNESRSYIAKDADGNIHYECQYKKEATQWVEENNCELEIEQVSEPGPIGWSLGNAKRIVEDILTVDHTSYQLYIAGKGNFRYEIYPEYKAHRASKPAHYNEIREYLTERWGALHVNGEEADDRVSWEQCTSQYPTCIVAIDKDLLNTPGLNYNYDKKIFTDITQEEGTLNFARQLLTGDSTDNIPGLPKTGPVAANKILPEWTEGWQDIVVEQYKKHYEDDWERIMIRNGQLLWMRRKPDEMWDLDYAY